jgi:hypothetical protein
MGVALVGQSQAIGPIDPSFGFRSPATPSPGMSGELYTGTHRQLTRAPVHRIVAAQIRGVRKPV